jgi:Ca2+:H+ antiporter
MSLPTSETTPLLQNGEQSRDDRSFFHQFLDFVKGEGEPSWAASFRWFFFGSYLNVLTLFIPLSFLSHNLNWDAVYRFCFSFIAIVPLAKVLCPLTPSRFPGRRWDIQLNLHPAPR